jgi:hypothetical protein
MSLFGLGGSKSSSSSASSAYGYTGSDSYSKSTQESLAQSLSQGLSTSQQDIAFADLFKQLYGGAAATAGALTGDGVQSAANMLFSGGTGFLDSLAGGSANDYLERRLSSENPVLQEQIGALGEDLGRFYREELNPAITGQAVAGGTLGGGRQGVAQAGAIREVGQQFTRGATALRAQDVAARDAAAQGLLGNRTAAAGVGLSALPQLLGIAQAGSLSSLAPYQALASILGGPTVLTQARAQDTAQSLSTSQAAALAFSQSFGEDWASSSSSGKSKSASIGFG